MKKSDKNESNQSVTSPSAVDRRKFLKGAAAGGMATLAASATAMAAQPLAAAALAAKPAPAPEDAPSMLTFSPPIAPARISWWT